MRKRLHIIYIPGLGDDNVGVQRKAVRTWRLWGVEPELFQMKWGDSEPWQQKFERLLARIDTLTSNGTQVALVGASAGASAVINAYAARKNSIAGCVLLAGKVNRPNKIGDRYRRDAPAFVNSAYTCEQSLQRLNNTARKHILSRFASIDEVVYKADSIIPGAKNQMVPSIGHAVTIASQLVFGAHSFIRFLKHQHPVRH